MPIEILMPALSPTMKEGNLVKWHKKEGDIVKAGELLAEIETDKATMEVEAVDEGVVGKILVLEGSQNVLVNQAIALLLSEGEEVSNLEAYEVKNIQEKTKEKKLEIKQEEKEVRKSEIRNSVSSQAGVATAPKSSAYSNKSLAEQSFVARSVAYSNDDQIASPLAKRIAAVNGLNLSEIGGTGPKGRIVKQDILDFLGNISSGNMIRRNPEEVEEMPNNNMRKVIASRLLESKQNVPHFYLTIDCNLDAMLGMRNQINNAAPIDEQGKQIYKISVNDLVIKATAFALKKNPQANASWSDEAILKYRNIDVSVAVAIEGGLITPIIRNADQKSVFVISLEMKSLAARARAGSLKLEEFQGGGFSISNLGMYGIKEFKAIINPPQSGILAIGASEKRAIVRNHKIEISEMMTASLSADHRIIDGSVGAMLLESFKFYIENPALLLI